VVSDPLAAETAGRAGQRTPPGETGPAKGQGQTAGELGITKSSWVLIGYFVYSWVRGLVAGHEGEAIPPRRTSWCGSNERCTSTTRKGDQRVSSLVISGWPISPNYWYAIMHFLVTIAVGVWIYRSHPRWARQLRTAWYCMNIVALLGFCFPAAVARRACCPAPGFLDTVVKFHTWGSWGDKKRLQGRQPLCRHALHAHRVVVVGSPSPSCCWPRRTWVRILGAPLPDRDAFRDRWHRETTTTSTPSAEVGGVRRRHRAGADSSPEGRSCRPLHRPHPEPAVQLTEIVTGPRRLGPNLGPLPLPARRAIRCRFVAKRAHQRRRQQAQSRVAPARCRHPAEPPGPVDRRIRGYRRAQSGGREIRDRRHPSR